jgi:hypothetical protein
VQNSLPRLFDGLASSLRDDVLPQLGDPYARAQVLAAVELLGNLGERVEWRCAELREECERLRGVLAAAPDPPEALLAEPLPDGNQALLAARSAHLEALAAAMAADAEALGEPLRELLGWQLGRELALLRTGMYKG